jgi:hypothetical protein
MKEEEGEERKDLVGSSLLEQTKKAGESCWEQDGMMVVDALVVGSSMGCLEEQDIVLFGGAVVVVATVGGNHD